MERIDQLTPEVVKAFEESGVGTLIKISYKTIQDYRSTYNGEWYPWKMELRIRVKQRIIDTPGFLPVIIFERY